MSGPGGRRRGHRPLAVLLYAAFVGLLLASYAAPLQQIVESRSRIPELRQELRAAEAKNAAYRREIGALSTPEGIERAARERYGLVRPGERVYIVAPGGEGGDGRP
ncbi:Septum formation initiator [Rubrobacter xylanophilus DSM 9941]|uniref:Septum formation initiator n=1 Tax=Rubrobacter xylanophilus (strain DSM 9941 / JCM 11954 / NBRC 16129 / PRD-1) TaxID=266117 RepID=Q1AXJ7_RUBXD|nr:septum formation initiator family protein [Rubrobacter xylanophilus]ABG03881.1 Septum formation initiator [Rubrobacter xylanophilus DSM 9941]